MRTIILKYDETILKNIKNRRLVVCVDSLDNIESQYVESSRTNDVMAIVVKLPYTSVSDIEFKEEWKQIPLIIFAHNIGDYFRFFTKVDDIRHLNVRIFLCNKSNTVFSDLKIMSSLGVDCGLNIEEGFKMDDEKLLDFASYYFMSPVPHASVEPFEFILRHLSDEANSSFGMVLFDDPLQYIEVTSPDDIDSSELSDSDFFSLKLESYYNHFMKLDDCAKCAAFKICNHKMSDKMDYCSKTMSEIYEYAELRNDMNNNHENIKTICQL